MRKKNIINLNQKKKIKSNSVIGKLQAMFDNDEEEESFDNEDYDDDDFDNKKRKSSI